MSYATSSRRARCIAYGFPRGCSGGWDWLLRVEERREPSVRWERRGERCIAEYNGDYYVMPLEACDLLDTVAKGRLPGHTLLLGPPGTGKSSLLSMIEEVARHSGIHVVTVEPESLFSRYIGDAEKRLRKAMSEAESNAPSLMLIDEADAILVKRSGGRSEGYAEVAENLVRMFLRWMPRVAGRVSVIANTNMSISDIDPALTRSGRFRAVYFPVPSPEDVRLLFELYGKRPPDDNEIGKILAVAPTYANIVEYIKTGRLREYQISPIVKIVAVEPLSEKTGLPEDNVVIVAEKPPASAVLAAVHASTMTGRPLLLLLNPRRYEDAVWISRSTGMPLAVPYSPYISDIVSDIVFRVERVYLLGREWTRSIDATILSVQSMTSRRVVHEMREKLGCRHGERLDICLSRVAFRIISGR